VKPSSQTVWKWVRFVIALALGFVMALAVAVLVSLVLSAELPWVTTGWQHEVSKYAGLGTYVLIIGIFVMKETKKRLPR
jgi:hypothetical protein